ncbi:MAG: hypothetical protein ABI548_02255 [Polyangiaceae bacterium]
MANATEFVHIPEIESGPQLDVTARTPGDLAASAFACFDAGVAAPELVTRLALSPQQVEALWRTWASVATCSSFRRPSLPSLMRSARRHSPTPAR